MEIEFKEATAEDCEIIYRWVNDFSVRKNAFNQNVIEYEDHKKWYENRLYSDDCFIFICSIHGTSVGHIRLDINENIGIIDYSVDKDERNKGYGTKILKDIVKFIENKDLNIMMLKGKVKNENIHSQKAFIKAGYEETMKKEYIEYRKKLRLE